MSEKAPTKRGELAAIRDTIDGEYQALRKLIDAARDANNLIAALGSRPDPEKDPTGLAAHLQREAEFKAKAATAAAKADAARPAVEALMIGLRVTYWFPRPANVALEPTCASITGIARDGKLNLVIWKSIYTLQSNRNGVEQTPGDQARPATWSWMASGVL